ncbi:aliphatic sulfonate ABC transporter permease SsuC [uncultured Alsobacter sp.]|uniref:aliphatic sulfonate ABC transporter permease SsuC n=1 Tax=uncultured Alsobacter sp. TaxID=1748258 RepID=UPI0025E22F39|nr:aliphatic sulfonate ABC transporter permease SsuC [uncultured Alsobacter sp.]
MTDLASAGLRPARARAIPRGSDPGTAGDVRRGQAILVVLAGAVRGRLGPWLVPLALLAAWQAAARAGLIAPSVLPAPTDVLAAGWKLILNAQLLDNIAVSARRAFSGFLVGGSLAFALGLANGLSRLSERLTDTTIQMLRNIPNLALIPLVILWFGIEEDAKLFLTSLGVFFPIYINTFHGVRTVDPQLVEMGRSYGMGRFDLFRRIILPGALPSIFVGVRYALGIMWLTLIVAETIAANSGIGYMAMNAREFMLVDVVVLAILIYALLGKLADSAVRVLERLCLAWHPAFQRS